MFFILEKLCIAKWLQYWQHAYTPSADRKVEWKGGEGNWRDGKGNGRTEKGWEGNPNWYISSPVWAKTRDIYQIFQSGGSCTHHLPNQIQIWHEKYTDGVLCHAIFHHHQ